MSYGRKFKKAFKKDKKNENDKPFQPGEVSMSHVSLQDPFHSLAHRALQSPILRLVQLPMKAYAFDHLRGYA